jgi:hypothetical protein
VDATLELIHDIGDVVATANDGYLTRSFCLLEVYAAVRGKTELMIVYVPEKTEVDSKRASATREVDRDRVSNFITSDPAFGGGDGAFETFDRVLDNVVRETEAKILSGGHFFLSPCALEAHTL